MSTLIDGSTLTDVSNVTDVTAAYDRHDPDDAYGGHDPDDAGDPGGRWESGLDSTDGELRGPFTGQRLSSRAGLALRDGESGPVLRLTARAVAPVCRQAGCSGRATQSGMCSVHDARQAELREVAARVPSIPWPSGLAELVAAIGDRSGAWRRRAACRGRVRAMFPETIGEYKAALDVCANCEVVEACRAAGAREQQGVWGATTPGQRFPRRRSA